MPVIPLKLFEDLKKNRILFVSFLDFKKKSIQVIRKTPESYRDDGWEVHYVVLRDISVIDNYTYEEILDPEGISIYRNSLPLDKWINASRKYRILRRLLQKTSYTLGYLRAIKLILKNTKDLNFDVIYGYEIHGINTLKILKSFGKFKNSKTVFRYQGSFMLDYIEGKRISKILSNFDHLIALKSKPDLTIMTNDGTRGDKLWKLLNGEDRNFRFWTNGVDIPTITEGNFTFNCDENEVIFITVSRLNYWKRVDRAINLFHHLSNICNTPIRLFVLGDGPEIARLKKLAIDLRVNDRIEFKGSVPADNVKYYLDAANVFLSFYEGSNLGNPILEAIRMNKIIVTLNNGTTGDYIQHLYNGLIYDEDGLNLKDVAKDILQLIRDDKEVKLLKSNLKKTESKKLWTWEERFTEEISEVNRILQS